MSGPTAPPRLRSLRARITSWYLALLAGCVFLYSLATGLYFEAHVAAELDRRVHEDIELAVRAMVLDEAGRPQWVGGVLGKQLEEEEGGGHWLEVWGEGGQRLLATGTLGVLDLGPPPGRWPGDLRPRTVQLSPGAVRTRAEVIQLGTTRFLVRAGVSEAGVQQQIRDLWRELAAVSLAVLALGGLGGYLLARRLLGPLARLAEGARRITAEQLHERLPEEQSGSEVDGLRQAFNETLARLERSFDQLRSFTADASHELRTPLTALRSVGEVGLRSALEPEEYREVIGSMLEEVDRLTRLADELLTLARTEAGEAHLRLEPLDLAGLLREVAEHLSVLAEERCQVLAVEADQAVPVQADRLTLRQALVNLVDNAIKYSPEGTSVRLRAGATEDRAWVEVIDEGPGIAAEHREHVFERFYRVDKSRSREMGGTGLGLALVKWAAEAHGGRVELEAAQAGGSTFRIVLPKRAGATPQR